MSDTNIFTMYFTSQDNEKGPGATKIFYFNQGNMRTSKFCRWTPIMQNCRLTDITITLTPRFYNIGNGSVYIIKNGQRAMSTGFNLYEGVSVHRYSLKNPIDFIETDHIGMELILRSVPTDTWPAIGCKFEKVNSSDSGPSNVWEDGIDYDISSFVKDDRIEEMMTDMPVVSPTGNPLSIMVDPK